MNLRRFAPSVEPFVRLSRRVVDAHRRGELGFDGWAVLTYLVAEADEDGEWAGTLAELRDGVGYYKSQDTLARLLKTLRKDGWIDYDVRQGQKTKYRLQLVRAAIVTTATSAPGPQAFRNQGLPDAEVTSAALRCEEATPPHPATQSGGSHLRVAEVLRGEGEGEKPLASAEPTQAGTSFISEALATHFGEPTNDHERGRRSRAVKLIRQSLTNLGLEDADAGDAIRRAAGAWARIYPNARLTDIALANHFGELLPGRAATDRLARAVAFVHSHGGEYPEVALREELRGRFGVTEHQARTAIEGRATA